MRGGAPQAQGKSLLRTDPLSDKRPVSQIQFSGGVSEFIYGNEAKKFGDLGPLLAAEIRARVDSFCPHLEPSIEGIRFRLLGLRSAESMTFGVPSWVRAALGGVCPGASS